MFTRNHYINLISLISIGIINSLFVYNIFSGSPVYYALLFFIFFISSILLVESSLKPDKKKYIRVLIFLFSPAMYYLLFVEYAILINITLMIFLIFLSAKYIHKSRIDFALLIFSFLFGVVLSADPDMFIVFIIYLLYLFRGSLSNIFIFCGAAGIVCFLLLITYNNINNGTMPVSPLEIRSLLSLIPFWAIVIMVLCSVYIGWIVSDFHEVFFSSGLLFFIPSLFLIIGSILEFNEYRTFSAVLYMVYCAAAIPFFILSIRHYEVDKYLGKLVMVNKAH